MQVLGHFERLGHKCPEHYNPAEFVADLISLDFSSAEVEAASRARIRKLVDAWHANAKDHPPVCATLRMCMRAFATVCSTAASLPPVRCCAVHGCTLGGCACSDM